MFTPPPRPVHDPRTNEVVKLELERKRLQKQLEEHRQKIENKDKDLSHMII